MMNKLTREQVIKEMLLKRNERLFFCACCMKKIFLYSNIGSTTHYEAYPLPFILSQKVFFSPYDLVSYNIKASRKNSSLKQIFKQILEGVRK